MDVVELGVVDLGVLDLGVVGLGVLDLGVVDLGVGLGVVGRLVNNTYRQQCLVLLEEWVWKTILDSLAVAGSFVCMTAPHPEVGCVGPEGANIYRLL